jgi:hypothetical protein
VTVGVRVLMHRLVEGGYATSRGYRLYHYTTTCAGRRHRGCPFFLVYATPTHPDQAFTLELEARSRSGSWREVLTGSGHFNAKGRIADIIVYRSRSIIGIPLRIRFTMKHDADHLGNTSTWAHFRITP